MTNIVAMRLDQEEIYEGIPERPRQIMERSGEAIPLKSGHASISRETDDGHRADRAYPFTGQRGKEIQQY